MKRNRLSVLHPPSNPTQEPAIMSPTSRGESPKRPGRCSSPAVRVVLALVLALIFGAACAVEMGKVYVKDGKEYGTVSGTFRDKWWNHYERGKSYLDGEFYDDAVTDFRQPIRHRPQ